ncbi:hypothetical protein EWM64_g8783 [Hericium alpestre]|uniref:Uncharacterized protein n=1 Tax=Hericium alpestre TaxID=135208 RepID=A0A4Y9ZN13_9AGAM|nr:hypothetical protein EWM64_g8783 [Hericium alpestre]
MLITVPSQLNATTILNAKNDQLKYWIDEVNSAAAGKAPGKGKGKKVLTKEGKKVDLQKKLAEHLNIDLSAAAAAAPMPAGPLTVDKDIQKQQWSHLHTLRREWRDSARAGHPFTLSPPDADAAAAGALCGCTECAPGHEHCTTAAFFTAAPSCHRSLPLPPLLPASALTNSPFGTGGLNARAMELASTSVLLPFYGARVGPWRPTVTLQGCDGQPARAPDRVPSGGGMADSDKSCIPESVRASMPTAAKLPPPPLSHAPEPSTSRDGEVLDAAQANIKRLRQAVDLRDVIKQVEDGLVPEMRELYGPPPGQRKAVDPVAWDGIKVTVNRHECLHEQLMGEFGGDKDHFFAFFAVEPRKLKKGGDTGRDLRPIRLVAEAIRHMSDDVQDEMRAQEYVDPRTGTFSHERWKERWGSANRWEIWRAIAREYYGLPRQRKQRNSSVLRTDGNNI